MSLIKKYVECISFSFISIVSLSQLSSDQIHSVVVPQSSLTQAVLPLLAEDEVIIAERLTEATRAQLDLQLHLKQLMIEFKEQKQVFIQGEQTKRHASRMVRTAREILDIISNQHLQYLFSPDYIEELTLFSSIAGKSVVKRP
jgi:hypothetical protein